MRPQPCETEPHQPCPNASAAEEIEHTVRSLIGQASGARQPSPRPLAGGPEVMLDVEVDGVRCTLVRRQPSRARPPVLLSPREQEIARMVAGGYPNKTIAAVLDISLWTVSTHLRRVFAKLGVGTRAAMVARLLEEGPQPEYHDLTPQ